MQIEIDMPRQENGQPGMQSRKPRSVLAIAFHYPPDNSSTGVLRTLKFTQYLGDFGWRSEVITVPEALYPNRDDGLKRAIPADVKVHRPWAGDSCELFGFRGRYPSFLAVPDRYWTWFFGACRTGRSRLAAGHIDAIYSTFPLPTAHLIGLALKKKTGVPWIADFRDSWVDAFLGPVRYRVDTWLERKVISNADKVVMNTPSMRRYYIERYPDQPATKFVTIPNGYDENDFKGLDFTPGSKFELICAGGLNSENRDPEAMLKAAALAVERGWIPKDNLRLTFLGAGHYANSQRFEDQVRRYDLQKNVEVIVQRIPYAEALSRQARSDVLVVLTDDVQRLETNRDWTFMAVPAKLYEYLRLGKTMLIVSRAEAVRELLAEVNAAPPIPPGDSESAAALLRDAYAQRANRCASDLDPAVRRYERRELTRRLAALLDDLMVKNERAG